METVTDMAPDKAAIVAALGVAAMVVGVPVPEVSVILLPQVDWLAENRRSFPLLDIGRVHVRAPISQSVRIGPDRCGRQTGLRLGTHATTSGCLKMLQRVARRSRPRRVQDLVRFRILAIAAAKLVPAAQVTAVDIDPVSVQPPPPTWQTTALPAG